MNNIADFIAIQPQSIGWLYQEIQGNRLFVDESFQRRYVWNESDKIKLIETILLGYVMPEIYLWETTTDTITGHTQKSIVDGQQRLFAIYGFINNEFCLRESVLEFKNQKYSNKYFSDLDEDLKKAIFKYEVSVRMIRDKITRDQIVQMFDRLNCTAYNLTPQELRNAKYNGKFLRLSISIANNSFWGKYNFFNGMRMRRMKDVEFMSNILIYFRQGISGELSQSNLNSMYNLYESEYDDEQKDKVLFEKIIEKLQNLIDKACEDKKFIAFLKRSTHLYSIITLIAYMLEHNIYSEIIEDKIVNFITEYTNTDFITVSDDNLLKKYHKLSIEGTRSKINRIERFEILKSYLNLA